jgi:hypothetical protein
MKLKIVFLFLIIGNFAFSQEKDTIPVFKKRVLENVEVDFLASYYKQDGLHSAVSGGIGSEKLTDLASNFVVAMPMNDDDILTIDVGISAYTSASSSNINPFNSTGASGGGDDDNDDDRAISGPYGTPWQASSGASAQDALVAVVANYSHSRLYFYWFWWWNRKTIQ